MKTEQSGSFHFLASQLVNQQGECTGFEVMPDHVHALVRLPKMPGDIGFTFEELLEDKQKPPNTGRLRRRELKRFFPALIGMMFLSLAGEVSAADVSANPRSGNEETHLSSPAGAKTELSNNADENQSNGKDKPKKRYIESYKDDKTSGFSYGGSFRVRTGSPQRPIPTLTPSPTPTMCSEGSNRLR